MRNILNIKKNLNSGRITQDLLNNYTIGIGTACVKKKIFDKQKSADALAELDEDIREGIIENLSEKIQTP